MKLNEIYKVYENGTIAVRNVSLEFQPVGMVAIIGSSGCGKSTLLNLLSNNDIPSKGELLYNDIPYNKVDKDILNKDFAIIYQDFKLIENLSVYQNIMLSHELSNKDIDKDFVLSVADKLGITEILDEKVYSLSGGQQQRVAIARALVRRPKVIFADEPTGNLDSENTNKVYEILKELSKEILVVIVSHDKSITQYADRMIEMQNGKVIGDYKGDFTKIIEREKIEREVLDTEIDYKSKKTKKEQPNNKKPSKIGSKSIFSYTKGKNRLRKKKGLSLNSTLGLTIAFNNKSIAKKIILIVISIVMIMMIYFVTAVIFSSQESIFCSIMKSNEIPFVTMDIGSRDYKLSRQEYDKIREYIKQRTGEDTASVSSTYLHRNLSYIEPAEDVEIPSYSKLMNLGRGDTIYLDDVSQMGVKIIKGIAPKINDKGQDEIAISKTFYDYFLKVKRFKNAEGDIVDFAKRDIIGSYIEEFRFAITGVFEDYNTIDMDTLTEESELYMYNSLIYTIVRPKNAVEDSKSLNTRMSSIMLYNKSYGHGMMSGFFDIFPNDNSVKKYFYDCDLLKENLALNEVYVTEWFASDYRWGTGKELNVGDEITLDLVRVGFNMGVPYNKNELKTNLKFKVKGIIDSLENGAAVVVNEQLYNNEVSSNYDGAHYIAINSNCITPSVIKDIRNYIYMELSPKIKQIVVDDWQHENFWVDFYMAKHNGNEEYFNDVTDIARFYIALPLFVIAIVVYIILMCVLMSDMVKGRGKEILIMKSLGIKNTEIWKIFGAFTLFILFLQFVIGCLLGAGLLYGLNVWWMILADYYIYAPAFFVSGLSIFVMFASVLSISAGALLYSLNKFGGQNLRKLFQKQRK